MTKAQDQLDQATREMVVAEQLKHAEEEQKKIDERDAHLHADAEKVRAAQRERDRYEEMDKKSEAPIPAKDKKHVQPYVPQKTGAKAAAKHFAGRAVDYAKKKVIEDLNRKADDTPTPAKKPAPRKTSVRAKPMREMTSGWNQPTRGRGSGDMFSFMDNWGGSTTRAPQRRQSGSMLDNELSSFFGNQKPQGRKQPSNFGLPSFGTQKPQRQAKGSTKNVYGNFGLPKGMFSPQAKGKSPMANYGLGFLGTNKPQEKKTSLLDEMFGSFGSPKKPPRRGGWF